MLTRDLPPWLIIGVGCIAALLYVGFVLLGLPGRIKLRYGRRIPEAGPYSLMSLDSFIGVLDRPGISMYRRELIWDMVFAVLFGAALSFLMIRAWVMVWPIGSDLPLILGLIPLSYVLFDLLEDATLLVAIRTANLCLPAPIPSSPPMRFATCCPIPREDCPECQRDVVAILTHWIEVVVGFRRIRRKSAVQAWTSESVVSVDPSAQPQTPGILSGTAVMVARVWTVLKFTAVTVSVITLVVGGIRTVDVWPH